MKASKEEKRAALAKKIEIMNRLWNRDGRIDRSQIALINDFKELSTCIRILRS